MTLLSDLGINRNFAEHKTLNFIGVKPNFEEIFTIYVFIRTEMHFYYSLNITFELAGKVHACKIQVSCFGCLSKRTLYFMVLKYKLEREDLRGGQIQGHGSKLAPVRCQPGYHFAKLCLRLCKVWLSKGKGCHSDPHAPLP